MITNQTSKKCSCGANNKIYCAKCSQLKMVILLKNGFSNLKMPSKCGNRKINPVWYSHLSKNRKSANSLVNAMYRRFNQRAEYANAVNRLDFYCNTTKELITSIKL